MRPLLRDALLGSCLLGLQALHPHSCEASSVAWPSSSSSRSSGRRRSRCRRMRPRAIPTLSRCGPPPTWNTRKWCKLLTLMAQFKLSLKNSATFACPSTFPPHPLPTDRSKPCVCGYEKQKQRKLQKTHNTDWKRKEYGLRFGAVFGDWSRQGGFCERAQ